jgi:chromate transporter
VSDKEKSSQPLALKAASKVWFGISLRTFGGPAGQIAVMHDELVEKRRWIGEERFLHALSFCTLLPGPEAQQLAIYLGWLLNGTAGGLIAGILFVIPGYVTLMILSAIYAQWGETVGVAAVFAGLGPAVLAIVAQALWRIRKRALTNNFFWVLSSLSFFALIMFNIPFPAVVAAAGLAGVLANKSRPHWFVKPPVVVSEGETPPLIPDEALHGEKATMAGSLKVLVIGLFLWALPVVIAAFSLGGNHVFVQQGLFFSGTAVVTFGGAYAVLAYVAQRAVNVFQWLMPGEMVNGLALAETTPGPLIMVVQFVGFLGAFRNPGDLNPWVAAIAGSTLVVWVTFVPCFLFVFLGAPHVEGLRKNRAISAGLTAVTAAVVGVIANLSVYFALHTLFEKTHRYSYGIIETTLPNWETLNIRSGLLTVLAGLLVFKYKRSTVQVMIICAIVGSAAYLLAR